MGNIEGILCEKDELERDDEVILPGFRFHPTDEELIGFYLMRKIRQRPLHIELIQQLDIYKYNPWDLPKLATTGEKEWYFYCRRDRKYRNSARSNRVTGAGFWKATGTDRPIYSSEGTKCIGLKKSLVFCKGRAAKGIKTDWMMHEFRLPTTNDTSSLQRRPIDNIPANDSWVICKIFKKTSSMAQRTLTQSWLSPPVITDSSMFSSSNTNYAGSLIQFGSNNVLQPQQQIAPTNYPTMDATSSKSISNPEVPTCISFSIGERVLPSKPTSDIASMIQNLPSTMFEDFDKDYKSIDFGNRQEIGSFAVDLETEMRRDVGNVGEEMCMKKNTGAPHNNNNPWETVGMGNFPFCLGPNPTDTWMPNWQ